MKWKLVLGFLNPFTIAPLVVSEKSLFHLYRPLKQPKYFGHIVLISTNFTVKFLHSNYDRVLRPRKAAHTLITDY